MMHEDMPTEGAQARARSEPNGRRFRTLPSRVRPDEMVESHDTDGVNHSGAPAGDPETEFMLRHLG